MSLTTSPDVPTQIIVPSHSTPDNPNPAPLVSTERRLNGTWSISVLKSKLEPITGIPAFSQLLRLQTINGTWTILSDDSALLSSYGLRKGAVIEVTDTRPRGSQIDWRNVDSVEKYVMPEEEYEKRSDSVMAWKKRAGLGRFNPSAKTGEEVAAERRTKDEKEIKEKEIAVGLRARVGKDDGKRGVIKWVGEVEGLGGERERGCVWVGVELDEPVGRNDGSVVVERNGGKETVRLWDGGEKYGVIVRPEKVEVGSQWGVLDDLMDEDMEEM